MFVDQPMQQPANPTSVYAPSSLPSRTHLNCFVLTMDSQLSGILWACLIDQSPIFARDVLFLPARRPFPQCAPVLLWMLASNAQYRDVHFVRFEKKILSECVEFRCLISPFVFIYVKKLDTARITLSEERLCPRHLPFDR